MTGVGSEPPPPAGGSSTATIERTSPAATPIRWWREIAYIVVFYGLYSLVRNQFGSASVDAGEAYRNAVRLIDLERALHVFNEATVQSWFLGVGWLLRSLNVFYGSAHFVVTAGALIWLAWRHPRDYPVWRNTIMAATGLALVGYALFPLMPPRLLCDCSYGAGPVALTDGIPTFVDTLSVHGGLWSFGNSTVQAVSNQYAAMPSLHIAWATWCALVLVPRVRHRTTRVLAFLYPFVTLFTIVVTGNHYWLDAVGGLVVLGGGYLIGSRLAAMMVKHRRGGDTVAESSSAAVEATGPAPARNAPTPSHDGKEAPAP